MSITTAAHQILETGSKDRTKFPEKYWELIEKYREPLVQQALLITGSREDAEDIVQETFCEAFRGEQKLSQASSIGNWLRIINHRNAQNRVRLNKRHDSRKMAQKLRNNSEQMFTTGGFSVLELRDSVRKVLHTIPQNLRDVVELRYWEHLSYKDIAVRLGIPVGNIGGMLLEASLLLYDKLRIQLELPSDHSQIVDAKPKNEGGHPRP